MGVSQSLLVSPLPKKRTVMVTGGSKGIGYETSKRMAMMGLNVIIVTRSDERGIEAIKRMEEEFQEAKAKKKMSDVLPAVEKLDIEYMICDLASLKSVMTFIEKFKASKRDLHVLICNASTYAIHEGMTEDNHDAVYQVNYLSHFLIVAHFLPIMEKSGDDCRIVLISSQVHHDAKFDADLAAGKKMKEYDGFQCYANTKLYQIMQMHSLDHVLEETTRTVDILAVHPGKLDAQVFENDPQYGGFNCRICCMSCCGKMHSTEEGAVIAVYTALSPTLKGTSRGYYLNPMDGPTWPSKGARYVTDICSDVGVQ
ncbi:hypothetical protein CHS0354_012886, partial [Potamilus streckersoni]